MSAEPRPPWTDAEPDEPAFMDAAVGPGVSCPPPGVVCSANEGALPGEAQVLVAAHLERCGLCRALAEAMAEMPPAGLTTSERDRIRSRLAAQASSFGGDVKVRWWWRAAGLLAASAAAVAVTVAAWGAWNMMGGALVPALPERRVATRAVAPPEVLKLEKAPFPVQADDLLWRGVTAGHGDGAARELARARAAYDRGNYALAADVFGAVTRLRPEDPLPYLFLGISRLFLNRLPEAITALSIARQLAPGQTSLSEEATWYLAYAYHRNGQRERAALTLDELCRGNSLRSALACAALLEVSRHDGREPR